LVGGCRPRVAAPPGPNTMPPVGLGTSEDRSLEEAIKNAALRPSPPVPNPLLRCLQCLQLPLPAEGTSEASIAGVEARLVGDYHTSDTGEQGTLEWRRFVYDADGRQISYWHDLPLSAGARMLHAFIEIPKNTRAKYEVCRTEATNPIKQDEKKGKPRFYNLDIKWNYGAFPQTWEQPDHAWKGLDGYGGDDDPVDVVDISSEAVAPGSIIVCKPLAALAMIDEGEVDWKIVVINVADPLAPLMNTMADVEKHRPGEIDAIREWFTWYKATDPETGARDESKKNIIGFDGRALGTEDAWNVVREAHGTWAHLVTRQVKAGERKLA